MKFYKVVARPSLLYGSGTWVTTNRDMTCLEAAEKCFLRSVTEYTRLDKIRSEVTRKELEISGIQYMRLKYKENWNNHLERMDNTRLPKHALEEEEIVDTSGNNGSVLMPEQVERPNSWRKIMMMMLVAIMN